MVSNIKTHCWPCRAGTENIFIYGSVILIDTYKVAFVLIEIFVSKISLHRRIIGRKRGGEEYFFGYIMVNVDIENLQFGHVTYKIKYIIISPLFLVKSELYSICCKLYLSYNM